jgi:hypothetical protein
MMSAHFRPPVIDALKALWVALPIKAPASEDDDPRERQMAILDAYCYALRSYSPEAIANTVDYLREGKIKGASLRFCPTSPELATYVRDEQSRLDAVNRPKSVTYAPVGKPWIVDWRVVHRQRTEELAATGFHLIAEQVDHPSFVSMATRRQIPAKSTWFWSLWEVWGPAS